MVRFVPFEPLSIMRAGIGGWIMPFVIKLFAEITIKSAPVRRQMVRRLAGNIERILRRSDVAARVEAHWDHLQVQLPEDGEAQRESVARILVNMPGIAHVLDVEALPLPGMEGIVSLALARYGDAVAGRTFAVRCKRAGKGHGFTSLEVERAVGAALMAGAAPRGVDLRQPEVLVQIEIRDQQLLLVRQRHEGLGGYPLGEVESVLSLLSGGFDSAVASFLTMKRGLCTHFLFFNLGGHAHEMAVKEIALYLWMRYGSSHRVRFITVPFEAVVAEILQHVDDRYMGVVLKRCMLRVAERVAAEMQIPALVTGESVAQVSSQTLTNLAVIERASSALVLRPLAAMDKRDIINLAIRIGTEPFSRHMPEYCGVISKNPATRAKLNRVLQAEASLDMQVLETAFATRRAVAIDALADDLKTAEPVPEVAELAASDTVIDIRHPDEAGRPVPNVSAERVLAIPFYELHRRFADLPKDGRYLLYCERGVMSRLHAGYLCEQGSAAGVYRPLK